MIRLRRSEDRGHANHGWLDTYHTFSFGNYYDPNHMGFRTLRVINQDRIAPSAGFGTHPHRDMEILTYMVEGSLEHRDSTGGGSVIRAGDLQRMTAGSGIRHSEYNASAAEHAHLLQIWIHPFEPGLEPSYQDVRDVRRPGELRLVAGPAGLDAPAVINQDVRVYLGVLEDGNQASLDLEPNRAAWVHVARGTITLNGTTLNAGDGAAVEDEFHLEIASEGASECMVFDLA